MEKLLQNYKSLERQEHITLEDVINKITQEVWELIEAILAWDTSEMYKEASDVIVNIFSVAHELWIEVPSEKSGSNTNIVELPVLLWKWNSKIQWYRKRYSREDVDLLDLEDSTKKLVSSVLSFTDPSKSVYEVLKTNYDKFLSRSGLYKPQIDLKDYIASYENFPKPWINFKDISTLISSPKALRFAVLEMAKNCKDSDIIVWLDARGFIFWSLIAEYLEKPFVMLRKKWKLPWIITQIAYWLEYWKDILEIQSWVIQKWQKVSVIDDLLATWGTIKAAIDLVESEWWEINNLSFVISLDEKELINLESRKILSDYKIDSLLSYE